MGRSQAAPKAEDFPALGGMRPSSSAAAEASSSSQGAAAAAAGQAGVSEALKAANKASLQAIIGRHNNQRDLWSIFVTG